MTFDTTKLKASLQRDLDLLKQTGEELRVQATLARAELKNEWERLEKRLHQAQEEINRVSEHAKGPLHEIERASRSLLDEIKQAFDRLRKTT